jgi:hypothetical protein
MDDVKRELKFTPAHSSPPSSDEEPLTPSRPHQPPPKPTDTKPISIKLSDQESDSEEEPLTRATKKTQKGDSEDSEDSDSGESEGWITPTKKSIRPPFLPLPSTSQNVEVKEDEETDEEELKRQIIKESAKAKMTRGDSAVNDLVGSFSKISVSAAAPSVSSKAPVTGELRRSARLRDLAKK